MISTLATENEQLRAELTAWKIAAGWTPNGFGPQTPDEVAIFQREGQRVDGQVASFEVAKARRELEQLRVDLEELKTSSGLDRGLLEAAKEAIIRKQETLEQEQRSHAAYREASEHYIRAVQGHFDAAKPILNACDGLAEQVRNRPVPGMPWLEPLYLAVDEWLQAGWGMGGDVGRVRYPELKTATLEDWRTRALYAEVDVSVLEHKLKCEVAETQRQHELLVRAQPVLKACEAIPEYARKGLVIGMPWLGALYAAVNAWLEKKAAIDSRT